MIHTRLAHVIAEINEIISDHDSRPPLPAPSPLQSGAVIEMQMAIHALQQARCLLHEHDARIEDAAKVFPEMAESR